MHFKLLLALILLALDISILPIFLYFIVQVFKNQDLFFGMAEVFKILKFKPFEITGMIVYDPVFRKLWLVVQPIIFVLILLIFTKEINKNNQLPEKAGSGEFGTSRFLTLKEVDKKFTVWNYPEAIKKGGIVLGSKNQNKKHKFWLDADDTQVLLIGSTGSGKTLRIILPSVWALAQASESMVITDPKGEIYEKTADYLINHGYRVVMLDLRNMRKSKNSWNPMEPVNKAVKNGDIDLATEKAWDIANMFVHQRPQGNNDPIWPDGEESTIASLILAVAHEADKDEQKNIASVYSLLYQLGRPDPNKDNLIPLDFYINEMLSEHHPAKAAFGTASLAPYRTRASFFTGASSKLRLWADSSVAYMTSKQDHDLAGPGTEKTAIFLIIPDEKSTRNFLASLYIDQVYQSLIEEANNFGGKLPVRVNFLLDEFGNLPKIKDFDKKITVARSRNIRFLMAVQGLDQIKAIYKDTANTITGNCRTWIYLLTADNDTARIISQKVGQYTIQTKSYSTSSRRNDVSEGHSKGLTGRALLMPDEILRWNVFYPKKALILKAGDYPAVLDTPFLSDTPIEEDFNNKISVDFDSAKEKLEVNIWIPKVNINELGKGGGPENKEHLSTEEELDIL